MLSLKPLTLRDASKLARYYKNCDYQLCEYSVGVKLMWRDTLHYRIGEAAGCLITASRASETLSFDFPVPGPDGDVEAALEEIEAYCAANGIPLNFAVVPEREFFNLALRYPRYQLINRRAWCDYIYDSVDMQDFPGRRYSGQRNHINRFRRLWPDAKFRPLGAEDAALVDRFFEDYATVFAKDSASAKRELELSHKMFSHMGKPWFYTGGLELDGRLISVCLGEKCGETMIVHIEKALYGYEGVYPTTVSEFARYFGDGVRFFNREDDAGDKGLRTSKLQYLPARLADKLCLKTQNELQRIAEIPTLSTARLTLSAFEEKDKAAYNAICLDDERNKWWGYDYRKDYDGSPIEDYFLKVTREDFAARVAANFAIRLNGECIGEAVLYRFDAKGTAELGCRIAPAFAHSGYGTEAFAAVADWALYQLQLRAVVAKCYKENQASFRMLSSCMRRAGEDDTFFYFRKEV